MRQTYTRSDAEKLEMLVRIVGKWRAKQGLTIEEILTALRYEKPSDSFQALVDRAEENVLLYLAYKDVPGDVEE